jgi:transcription antitermination factor NusG
LQSRGWETLVPLYRTYRQWSDRVQALDLPLFGGYVLCRFPLGERRHIEDTPGVARIVEFGGRPAPLEESEIAAIHSVLASRLPLSPWPYLRAGDRLRVERGPLRGVEGTLIREKDSLRLVIGVELLQRSVAVEVDPDTVVPLRAISAAALE